MSGENGDYCTRDGCRRYHFGGGYCELHRALIENARLRRELEEARTSADVAQSVAGSLRAEIAHQAKRYMWAALDRDAKRDQLTQIRTLAARAIAACEKASPGPWSLRVWDLEDWMAGGDSLVRGIDDANRTSVVKTDSGVCISDEDANAIAECVNFVRALNEFLNKEEK